MPGFVKSRKFSKEKEGELKIRVLDILLSTEESMNIDEIKLQDVIFLGGYTNQKISRVLNSLIEMGLVKKSKSKSTGRLKYKSVAKMQEQGYNLKEEHSTRNYSGVDWDIEDELMGNIYNKMQFN